MTTTISCAILTLNQGLVRLLCMQFRSNEHTPVQNSNISERLFRATEGLPGCPSVTIAFCNFIQQHLIAFQLFNTTNEQFHENLAVIIVDGTAKLDVDLSVVSDKFFERDITLVIATFKTTTSEICNLYRQLARNTGGEHMPISNISHTLWHIIALTLTEGYTLRQAFFHLHIENPSLATDDAHHIAQKTRQMITNTIRILAKA